MANKYLKEFIVFFIIACTFFAFVMFSELYSIHKKDYKTCKIVEESCVEDFECNLFTRSNYNVYCDALTGHAWQYKYAPYNLTKNIFAHVCREEGDIVYASNSSDENISVMSCISGKEYNLVLVNPYNANSSISIKVPDYIPYFKNIETNKAYLVGDSNTFSILLTPYEIADLSYNPEEMEEVSNKCNNKCTSIEDSQLYYGDNIYMEYLGCFGKCIEKELNIEFANVSNGEVKE